MNNTFTDQLDYQTVKGLRIACVTAKQRLQKDFEDLQKELRLLQRPRGIMQHARWLRMGKEYRLRRKGELATLLHRKKTHIAVLEETLKGARYNRSLQENERRAQ